MLTLRLLMAALATGLLLPGCGDGGTRSQRASGPADCGTVIARAPVPAKMRCFDDAFSRCAPGRVLIDNRGPMFAGTKVRYEIRRRSGPACRVAWPYVALPSNPGWQGKGVECPYRTGRDFQAALNAAPADLSGCRGSLLAVLG